MKPDTSLRELLERESSVLMPVAYDVITAKLAERAGFKAAAIGGFSISAVKYGLPDLGFVSCNDVEELTRNVAASVRIPLLVDADGGYGNESNVALTIQRLEAAGASAVFIEDQQHPKRCGHLNGKSLTSAYEMAGKVRAAVKARKDPSLIIIARTDAIGVEGFDGAIRRARSYVEAGAEAIFVEAPRNMSELRRIPEEIPDVPLLVNMLEGGRTPIMPKDELERMGYKIIAYPLSTLLASIKATEKILLQLAVTGTTAGCMEDLCDLEHFNDIIGLNGWLNKCQSYLNVQRTTRPHQSAR
ncbi:oxaloacetate decarboxylase [Candidatus Micrarchaeota archaeon]|nr:oxaloacetate decarboxylase [Candidatus Micrarchaeota archaeon]